MNQDPVVEAIVPDPTTLFVHNNNVLPVLAYISAAVAVVLAITGNVYQAILALGFTVFCFSLRLLVCAWVHTFAAYAIATQDPKLKVRQ